MTPNITRNGKVLLRGNTDAGELGFDRALLTTKPGFEYAYDQGFYLKVGDVDVIKGAMFYVRAVYREGDRITGYGPTSSFRVPPAYKVSGESPVLIEKQASRSLYRFTAKGGSENSQVQFTSTTLGVSDFTIQNGKTQDIWLPNGNSLFFVLNVLSDDNGYGAYAPIPSFNTPAVAPSSPGAYVRYELDAWNTPANVVLGIGLGETKTELSTSTNPSSYIGQNVFAKIQGDDRPDSIWVPVTINPIPATPRAVVSNRTSTSISAYATGVDWRDEVEYSLYRDGYVIRTNTSGEFNYLTPSTRYSVTARRAATSTSFASAESSRVNAYTAFDAPSSREGYTIHYDTEKVEVLPGYELRSSYWNTYASNNWQYQDSLLGKTVEIRHSSTSEFDASAWTTITIPARPSAPTLQLASATATSLTASVPWSYDSNYEYGISTGTYASAPTQAQKSPSFTDLTPGTTYTLWVRKLSTSSAFASNWASLTVGTNFATPAEGEGYSIDYFSEKIRVNSGYTLSVGSGYYGDTYTDSTWQNQSSIVGKTATIKKAAQGHNGESESREITIPARPAKPELSVADRSATTLTAAVTGDTDGVEYAMTTGDSNETPTSGQQEAVFTDLDPAHSYRLWARVAATSSSFASEWVNIEAATDYAAPEEGTGYTINYTTGILNPDENYEIAKNGTTVTSVDLSGLASGDTIAVRRKASDTYGASAYVDISKPSQYAKPDVYNNDGVLGGYSSYNNLEYRIKGNSTWYSLDSASALDPGTYEIRIPGSSYYGRLASEPTVVTITAAQTTPSTTSTTTTSATDYGYSYQQPSRRASGSSGGLIFLILLILLGGAGAAAAMNGAV